MDEREQRQLRLEYDVDEVIALIIPAWYLRLTAPIAGHWRREVVVVIAVLAIGIVFGLAAGLWVGR